MSRTASFSEDDETHQALRSLGYSQAEIGATAGQLPSDMETETKLRLSLRALSAESSRVREEQAQEKVAPVIESSEFKKENKAYNEGRRDLQREISQSNPKPPRQGGGGRKSQKPPPSKIQQVGKLLKVMGGVSKGAANAGKVLNNASRAQKQGRRK